MSQTLTRPTPQDTTRNNSTVLAPFTSQQLDPPCGLQQNPAVVHRASNDDMVLGFPIRHS